jgi:hypothetical protein
LYRSLPGVFDIEKLRPKLQDATTFLEVNASSTLEDEVPSATAVKPAENTKPRPAPVHFPLSRFASRVANVCSLRLNDCES